MTLILQKISSMLKCDYVTLAFDDWKWPPQTDILPIIEINCHPTANKIQSWSANSKNYQQPSFILRQIEAILGADEVTPSFYRSGNHTSFPQKKPVMIGQDIIYISRVRWSTIGYVSSCHRYHINFISPKNNWLGRTGGYKTKFIVFFIFYQW